MKFRPQDRMLQLGVVPPVTGLLKQEFPQASASLWQRGAKTGHRRALERVPEFEGSGPVARRARLAVSLAALLVGFDKAAPEGSGWDEDAFVRAERAALRAPIVQMLAAGPDPLADEGVRELAGLFASGRGASAGPWAGEVRLEGGVGGEPPVLACRAVSCAIARMCAAENRPRLAPPLCEVETSLAASCGAAVERASCLARGDRACELRFRHS